jgi:hypothetical protein
MDTFWIILGILCGVGVVVIFNEIQWKKKLQDYSNEEHDLPEPRCYVCDKHNKDNPCYEESCAEAQKSLEEIRGMQAMTPEEIRERDRAIMERNTPEARRAYTEAQIGATSRCRRTK